MNKKLFYVPMTITLDGTQESVHEHIVKGVLASRVDLKKLKRSRWYVQLPPFTIQQLKERTRMGYKAVTSTLRRLEDKYVIFTSQETRRVYKSRTVIQIGVDNGVLFHPTMIPERMYKETIKNLIAQGKGGEDKIKLNQIIDRAFQHLDRFTDEARKTRLHPKLIKMQSKLKS